MVIVELSQYGGDIARRVRATLPEAVIRKDRDLARGGLVLRIQGASPEQVKALRSMLPHLDPGGIAEVALEQADSVLLGPAALNPKSRKSGLPSTT